MYQTIFQEISKYEKIIIHRHTRPDGDALGSQIGLKEAILATFPTKGVFVVGDTSERYSWIGKMDEIENDIYEGSLAIVVDCGTDKLISDDRYKLSDKVIKIDHHIPQGEYGDIMHVDTSFESCAGIIADMIFNTDLVMNDAAANALFTGIVTDSGRFRYGSTTPKTFINASKLMEYKIDTDYIYNKIYTEKLATVKLKAYLTTKFEISENGVAYLINTKEDIAKYNVGIFDISRGMVNIMGGIEEIKIWANFSEDVNNDIYVELRSSGLNVNQVATKYGGGGHLQASGCTLKDFDTVYKLIEDLNKVAKGEDINV